MNEKENCYFTVEWELHKETQRSNKRSQNMPTKRWGHTLCSYRDYIYLYGGEQKRSYQYSSQAVYRLDVREWGSQEWLKIVPKEGEVIPAARDCHSANIIDKRMYIIGGSKNGEKTNDIFYFDLRLNECKLCLI